MIRRLEQVAALVVAAGLALVSYWLFFSWARGGGAEHRLPGRSTSSVGIPLVGAAQPWRPSKPLDWRTGGVQLDEGRSARATPSGSAL